MTERLGAGPGEALITTNLRVKGLRKADKGNRSEPSSGSPMTGSDGFRPTGTVMSTKWGWVTEGLGIGP